MIVAVKRIILEFKTSKMSEKFDVHESLYPLNSFSHHLQKLIHAKVNFDHFAFVKFCTREFFYPIGNQFFNPSINALIRRCENLKILSNDLRFTVACNQQ